MLSRLPRPLSALSRLSTAISTSTSHKIAGESTPEQSNTPPRHPDDPYHNIVVETLGRVRTIGLNRPERRNAVDHATAGELYRAFREFEDDSRASVAVLYGNGGTFCAGYDLKELASASDHHALSKATFGKDPAPMV